MGSASLLHASLSLRMESGQYGWLVQEGEAVLSTVLCSLTPEVKSQKEMSSSREHVQSKVVEEISCVFLAP